MENSLAKRRFGRKGKITAVAAIALMAAGASVYAVNAANSISETEAKQIAMAQVRGADQSHITKCIRDFDDGREEYDIEIIYNGFEYDFEISAKDGRIFDQNKEQLDWDEAGPATEDAVQTSADNGSNTVVITPEPSSQSTVIAAGDIGQEQAKSIALEQVSGASATDITSAYSDYDDGILEYNVEIRCNGYEYDFEIDGSTGQILSKDVDRIDFDD